MSVVWTTLCILAASLFITWGAEAAQFFVAQGFALAILAWMQTLPEFAVEAVLAWHQQTNLLMANLTGALVAGSPPSRSIHITVSKSPAWPSRLPMSPSSGGKENWNCTTRWC